MWFFCYKEAEFVQEACDTKDIAYMFLSGIRSYKEHAKENADAWLEAFQEDEPDGTDIEDRLKDHFEV